MLQSALSVILVMILASLALGFAVLEGFIILRNRRLVRTDKRHRQHMRRVGARWRAWEALMGWRRGNPRLTDQRDHDVDQT